MRPDQNPGNSTPSSDDPLISEIAGLDPAALDPAPVVGSNRHLRILENAMTNPPSMGEQSGAESNPLDSTPSATPLPMGARSETEPKPLHLDDPATYPATPTPNGRRRGPGRLAVGIAAILATFAGGFAFNTLTQPDGAATPEAAVQALFDAIDDEDLIGVVESLDPVERRIVRPALERLADEMERVGAVSDDLDLGGVDGIDLTVSDLDLRASYLADEVATVSIVQGSISGSGDMTDLPLGQVLKDLIEREEPDTSLTSDDSGDLSGIDLVARKVDGSWHVSLLYTGAEFLRQDMDPLPDPPSYGRGIVPQGAESPEEAVRQLVEAGLAVDTRRMVELMPPGEGDVFHDYGPILIEDLADADPVDIEVEAMDLEVGEHSGNTAEVRATRLRLESTDDYYDDYTIDFDGECTVTTLTYGWYADSGYEDENGVYQEDLALVEEGTESQSWDSCNPNMPLAATTFFPFTFDVGAIRVTTVEHDGLWYVSPATSVLDWLLGSVEDYDADQFEHDLRAMDRPWLTYADEFWDACGVARPDEDADWDTGYSVIEVCFQELPQDFQGPYHSGGGGPFGLLGIFTLSYSTSESYSSEGQAIESMEWPGEECYQLDQGTPESRSEVASCLEALADDGEVDPYEVQSYRCSAVYDDLYGDGSSEEPTLAEQEAAEHAWSECMEEISPPGSHSIIIPPSGGSSGTDRDSTQTTVVPGN